jgi:hypothetical protein
MFNDSDYSKLIQKVNLLICELFDFIYDGDHYSDKRIKRSILSSIIGILVFSMLIGYSETTQNLMIRIQGTEDYSLFVVYIVIVLLMPLLFNFIPDYISLIETRVILDLARNKRTHTVLMLLFADLIFTTLIFIIGVTIFLVLLKFLLLMDGYLASILNIPDKDFFTFHFYYNLIFKTEFGLVLYLTTFLTSFFWIIFVITYFLALLFHKLSKLSNYVFFQLTKTRNPVTVIVTGLNFIIVAFYFIFYSFI